MDHNEAPDKIVATHLNGGVPAFSRPVCPYPQQAEYTGAGDRKDASSWACITKPFAYDASFYKFGNREKAPIEKGAGR